MTDVSGAPAPAPAAAPAPSEASPAPATLVGGAATPALPAAEAPKPEGSAALYPDQAALDAAPVEPPAAEPPKDGEAAAEPALTPESYKDLKFRDGMSPSEASLKSFTELAAKAKLTPEDAQALVDLQQDIATEQGTAFRAAQEADFNKTQTEWRKEATDLPWIKANPQLDPKLPGYNEGLASISVLFDEFDPTSAFKTMLDQTGVGNHPAALQFLYNLVQTLVEGSPTSRGREIPSGSNGRARSAAPADIMYPNTPTT